MGDSFEKQQTELQSLPSVTVQPKSVKVNVSTGNGMDIEWRDGHKSHYTFQYLRDACPCSLCDHAREAEGRLPGEPEKQKPGALPMFKPAVKPDETAGVGKYAIRFAWNDGHEAGIYSWEFLREWCPCRECTALRSMVKDESIQ